MKMRITIQIIAILIWTLIIGIWLDQTLPDYGNALGVALFGDAISFVSINTIANILKLSLNRESTLPATPTLAPPVSR